MEMKLRYGEGRGDPPTGIFPDYSIQDGTRRDREIVLALTKD